MDFAKLALPLPKMLLQAIHAHRKTHNCELPKRFELHPEIVASLKQEMNPLMAYSIDQRPDHISFYGVEIREDLQATRPKLINCRNEVEYL